MANVALTTTASKQPPFGIAVNGPMVKVVLDSPHFQGTFLNSLREEDSSWSESAMVEYRASQEKQLLLLSRRERMEKGEK